MTVTDQVPTQQMRRESTGVLLVAGAREKTSQLMLVPFGRNVLTKCGQEPATGETPTASWNNRSRGLHYPCRDYRGDAQARGIDLSVSQTLVPGPSEPASSGGDDI